MTVNPDELLTHADFVKTLSRSLVLDEHRAADIEQETWLAALKHPPSSSTSIRSWLSSVAHNIVCTMHRSDTRRKSREQQATVHRPIPTPDEISAREEARRRMVEAVLSLEEPYLTTVLLRFYENRSAREVSEALDVPLSTVKTRIRRGLQQIKEKLDEDYSSSRKLWVLSLSPLAGLNLAPSAGAGAAVAGAIAMSTKLKISLAAAVVIGILFPIYHFLWTGDSETDNRYTLVEQNLTEQPTVPGMENPSTPEALAAAIPADPEPGRVQMAPKKKSIAGTVIDRSSGLPVSAFQFALRDAENSRTTIRETVHDDKGRFTFPVKKGGRFHLTISSSRHVKAVLSDLLITEEDGLSGLRIELDPGLSVSGCVVEDATGNPVPGALIGTDGHPGYTHVSYIHRGETESCIHAESDGKGRFTLSGLGKMKQKIAAMHPDFAEAWVEVTPGEGEEIELRLVPGFRVYGKAFYDDGEIAPNIRIDAIYRGIPVQHSRDVLTGPDGSYRTAPYLPGHVDLGARHGSNTPGAPVFTSEQIGVEIIYQDVEVNFGEMDKFVTWRGTFYDINREPVSKGLLIVRPDLDSGVMYAGIPPRRLQCDERGRFELLKVQPGYYTVGTESDPEYTGTDSVIFEQVHFTRPGYVERDIQASGAIINGTIIDGKTGKAMEGKQGKVMAKLETDTNINIKTEVDEKGMFSMKGVPAGTYVLWAEVAGRMSRELDGIVISDKQVINNLDIKVYQGGWLKLKASGCLEEPWLSLSLEQAGKSGPPMEYNYTTRNGILEESLFLETGEWIATICFRQSGMLQRRIEIKPDKETEFSFDWKDIVPFEGSLSIEGSLTRFDGTPLAGARVLIGPKPGQVPGLERYSSLDLHTDDKGCFVAEGARPGRWDITVQYRERGRPDVEYRFPDLQIPNNPTSPFPLDLVLSSGRVKGSFFDRRKDDSFGKNGPWWHVILLDATRESKDVRERDLIVCEQGQCGGSRFDIEGIPAGEYRLKIEISGYHIHCFAPFTLKEGEELDVGKIGLEPCGLLDLQVVDREGKPVEWYDLFCNGEKCTYKWSNPPGLLWEKLPLGNVMLRIHKKGFKDRVVTMNLEPYQEAEASVVMEPE